MSSRALAAAAAAVVALVALIVFLSVMADSAPRRTGTNSGLVPTHAIVPPGKTMCQKRIGVPAGTGAAAPWVGGYAGAPGPPATVTIASAGRIVATGSSPATYPTGITLFKLDRTIERALTDARVCLTNRGRRELNVYGDFSPGDTDISAPAYADNVPVSIRLDWYGPKPRSWWSFAGTMADRFPLAKAGFLGAWSFWVALAAALAISIVTVVRLVREAPR